MNLGPENHAVYRFGVFEANSETGEFLRKGVRVKLQEQPFRLLSLLLENAGEIVSRESVRQRLWPGNTFVEFDASLSVAVGKLREALGDDADNPRFIETVPRRGYRFVAPVERLRQQTHSLPSKDFESVPFTAVSFKVLKYSRIALAILVCLGVAVAGAVFVFHLIPRSSTSAVEVGDPVSGPHIRRSVAVLGFRNLPGRPEDAWLSSALSEMLNTELAAGGGLRLVSGEDVERAKREVPVTNEDTLAKSTLQRLRTNPGANVVVLGAYTPMPGNGQLRIRLDIRLQDTNSGETIAEEAITGNEADLFELASRAGADLRRSLGLSSLSGAAAITARASLPSNQQAVRLYAEGRQKLWDFDFLGARDLLVKAVAADPNYPLTHSALSEAWWHSGYESKARAEAQRALALSKHLSQEDRLLVEGQYHRTMEDYPKAVEAYQSLFKLFPDNLNYGLLLASAQVYVKPADSLRTLASLHHLPFPAGEDARIDMVEASAWINTDFAKARESAKRAIAKGNAQGSHALVSRTYGILCQQDPAIGATAEAISDCQGAMNSAIAAGDRHGEAMMMTDLADVYWQQGHLAHAEAMLRQANRQFRQVGDPEGIAATLNNLGDARFSEGDLGEAAKLLGESIPNYQAVEDKDGIARALNDLGDVSQQKGDLDAARARYRQAMATAQEIDDNSVMAYVMFGLGDVEGDRGNLAAARKAYEESLALRTQTGEKQAFAETQVALARLAIEEGHAPNAEIALRKCKAQFHQEQQADDELTASAVLIRALVAQGKNSDAKAEEEQAESLANKSENFLDRLQFSLASARILLASDHPEPSRPQMDEVLKDAKRRGFAGVEFEARLALAELEKKSGHTAAAQAQLTSLARDARAKGFALIARKATKEVVLLNPNHSFGYANLVLGGVGSNRFGEAEAVCEKTVARRRDSDTIHMSLYTMAFMEGNRKALQSLLSAHDAHE